MLKDVVNRWTTVDTSELYDVGRWGNGYFSVHANGHLLVHPERDPARAIDLKELVDRLELRGLSLPILVRFSGILKDRIHEIHQVFANAMKEYDYQGGYSCVYPIKVNQQRQVVEEIVQFGKPYGFGLEAGSKPELLAVVAMTDADAPIICNGFKDSEFLRWRCWPRKWGGWSSPCWKNTPTSSSSCITPSVWGCGHASACVPNSRPAGPDAGKRPAATAPSSD